MPNVGQTVTAKRGEYPLVAKAERWVVVRFGKPMKGQHYLSGAIVEAWRAPNDLNTEFWIVEAVAPTNL